MVHRRLGAQAGVTLACALVFVAVARAQDATPLAFVRSYGSARTGTTQVSSTGEGVRITGTVDGAVPKWPRSAAELEGSDRIEITVADSAPTALPPVGWGHQFGYEYVSSEKECATKATEFGIDTSRAGVASCAAWFRKQVAHRETLRRLFVRTWALAPSVAVEIGATPVFSSLDSAAQADAAPLKPEGVPRVRFSTVGGAQGYSFDILVPWSALPPVQGLTLRGVRVKVDVISPDGGRASTSRDSTSLQPVVLAAPRESWLTPCRLEPSGAVMQFGPARAWLPPSDSARLYVRPGATGDVRQVILVDTYAQGYMYAPDPSTIATTARGGSFWARDIGQGQTICGPRLAYKRGDAITRSEFVVDSPDSLSTKRLAGGDILVKHGPRVFSSYYGSGQCGACPRVSLELFRLDGATGAIDSVFTFFGIAEPELSDYDVTVSADWSSLTLFEEKTDYTRSPPLEHWTSTTFCWRPASKRYEACGKKDPAQPPSPRRVKTEPPD